MEIVGRNAPSDRFYNDFCLTQDRIGRWHCIGIVSEKTRVSGHLFHCVSNQLTGPYSELADVEIAESARREEIWAPSIAWKSRNRAFMFYAHGILNDDNQFEFSMRVLESDRLLNEWRPVADSSLPSGNILFTEEACRDPEVIWIEETAECFLYYVAGGGRADPTNPNEVHLRRSRDLLHWGEPTVVLTTPPGYRAAESVFVLRWDRFVYLWVSGVDYGRMSPYISEDPTKFGDPIENRILEQTGHACEVVYSAGQYWISCVRVASRFGNAPAEADLKGVYLQPLTWVDPDGPALAKVVRRA